MVKLIVTDMDGTLLDDNHKINEEFWTVLDKIKEKGIKFAVASGRQYYNLLENFKKVKDDIIFLAENGSYVVENGEELYSKSMDKDGVKELLGISKKIEKTSIVLCGKKSAYIEDDKEEFVEQVKKYYHKYEIVESFDKVEDEILKIAIYDFIGSEENSHKYFDDYENKYKIIVSAKNWLDIMDMNTNKGIALQEIKKKLNIDYYEVLAFGDYMNDYEMLQEANYSYAMENAHEKVKEIANYIAPNNNSNGVVKVIKEYI